MENAHKERLRRIARNAVPTGVFSGNVLALEAVYSAGVAEGIQRAREAAANVDPVESALSGSDAAVAAIDAMGDG